MFSLNEPMVSLLPNKIPNCEEKNGTMANQLRRSYYNIILIYMARKRSRTRRCRRKTPRRRRRRRRRRTRKQKGGSK